MSKSWRVYAHHILDVSAKIDRIQTRGDLTLDDLLYDATLRNLQTLSEATHDIDALTVQAVIDRHLPPLIDCVQAMLAADDLSPI